MKFYVNDACIGCGLCAGACSEVFSMTDDGVAKAIEEDVPAAVEEQAKEAQAGCPVNAIETK